MSTGPAIRIGVDVGGTFTDLALETGAERHTAKVLTTPHAPEQAVMSGLGELVARAGVAPGEVGIIIHGTTLATNALIERKGAPTALVTTEGFRDVLELATESRFDQYDLALEKPPPLIPRPLRFTVPERLAGDGTVLRALDEDAVDALAEQLDALGIESVAVALLHSYANPAHEQAVAARLRARLPDLWISLSSEVSPEIREFERFTTTCANAYVQPMMAGYLARLEEAAGTAGFDCPLYLMLSNGGITDVGTARRYPVRLVESGPAGGAILAAHVARELDLERVVSFDMGGTTAKICLIDAASPQKAREFEIGRMYRFKRGSGMPVRIPVIEMVEIGAGGGSIARVDALRRIAVGPDSAGSAPGPACYGLGGTDPTVTDANLLLGRLAADQFAGGRMQLDEPAARAAFDRAIGEPLGHDTVVAAAGACEIVDENMANAARQHAVESGKSLGERTLIAFGGSAPLHAARLAEKLGIERVVVPTSAGVGSAVGFLRAPVAFEVTRTCHQRLGTLDVEQVNAHLEAMGAEAQAVVERGAPGAARRERRFAYMRYVGQGHEIPVELPAGALDGDAAGTVQRRFDAAYLDFYGRLIAQVEAEMVGLGVAVEATLAPPPAPPAPARGEAPAPSGRRPVFDLATAASAEVPVYARADLVPGARIEGPAILQEDETTIVVARGFSATADPAGHVLMERVP